MTDFWKDAKGIYQSAWAFALACPLLFLVPVLFEFAQHVVEIDVGLYDSFAAAKAGEGDPARMAWGFAKTIAISLPSYWFYRFVVSGGDAAYARRIDPHAVLLWAIIFVPLVIGLTWLSLFGPPLGSVLGIEGKAETAAKVLLGVGQTMVGIYLSAWLVAWSQGNAGIGPLRSLRIMHGFFWRTLALMVAGILPLMALHYAGLFAIGKPEAVVWAAMILDSFVVGFLALTIHGVNAFAAKRAADARGISLLGSPARRDELATQAPA